MSVGDIVLKIETRESNKFNLVFIAKNDPVLNKFILITLFYRVNNSLC